MLLRQVDDMRSTIEKLYKRNYTNSRQTAKIVRQLSQLRTKLKELDEIRSNYIVENAKNGRNFDPETEGPKLKAASKYMDSLLKEELDWEGKPAITFDDIQKLEDKWKDKDDDSFEDREGKEGKRFSGDEIDVLIRLGLLLEEED